jgi:TIR domain-containing protein
MAMGHGGGAVLLSIGLIMLARFRSGRKQIPVREDPAAVAGVDPHQISVSYSRRDSSFVDRIVEHIERALRSGSIGRRWEAASYAAPIARAIKSSRLVPLMCSRNSFGSDHVVREVYVAGDHKAPFIAFLLDQAQFPGDLVYSSQATRGYRRAVSNRSSSRRKSGAMFPDQPAWNNKA